MEHLSWQHCGRGAPQLWSTSAGSTAAVEHLSCGASQLWSTSAVEHLSWQHCGRRAPQLWSTSAMEHLSYGAPQLWSTSAGSTMAMEHRSLEYPAEEHYRLEHHHRGEPQPAAPVQETQLSVLMDFANQLFNKSMI